jgi:hypothetical protein
MARELWIKEAGMVCEATGEVLARGSKDKILQGAEELGFKLLAHDDDDVIVNCGCGGNMYRCGEPAK